MGRRFVVILVMAVMFASVGKATADIVILRDGRRFTGKVTSFTDTEVAIHAAVANIPAKLSFALGDVLEVGLAPVSEEVQAVLDGRRAKPVLTPQEEAAVQHDRLFRILKAVDARLQWIEIQMIETDARAQRLTTMANRGRSPGEHPLSSGHDQIFQRRKDYLQRMRDRYAQVRNTVLERLGWNDVIS